MMISGSVSTARLIPMMASHTNSATANPPSSVAPPNRPTATLTRKLEPDDTS